MGRCDRCGHEVDCELPDAQATGPAPLRNSAIAARPGSPPAAEAYSEGLQLDPPLEAADRRMVLSEFLDYANLMEFAPPVGRNSGGLIPTQTAGTIQDTGRCEHGVPLDRICVKCAGIAA